MKKLFSNILYWIGWATVMSAFAFGTIVGFIAVLVTTFVYIKFRGDKDESVKYYQGMNALFLGECTAILIHMIAYCVTLI